RSVTVSNTPNLVNPFYPGADPFPFTPDPANATFLPGANIFSLQPGYHNIPSVQEFSLGVQQQYGTRWSSQLTYVANVSRHLNITRDEDGPIYRPNCTNATCNSTAQKNARRPFNLQYPANPLTYAAISEVLPSSNASYHSLQAVLTRHFDRRFSLSASYVWSKAMAYGATVDNYNIRSSYGPSGDDMPQKFTVSYIYALPSINHFGFLGKEVLGGWQVNGITTLRSGQPFNVTSGTDTNFDGTNNDRPNQIGNPLLPKGRSRAAMVAQYITIAAFAPLPAGTATGEGNTHFDSIYSPNSFNTDLSAFKTFPLFERVNAQFRAEAFNAFNNVTFYGPSAVLSSPANFGRISSSSGGRVLQFALRLSF
ncbi:MAG TPA: hypothetical protein VFW30_00110, partial [Bryocella sp.]|nr:hypothetical protein [Bryocella sp.]